MLGVMLFTQCGDCFAGSLASGTLPAWPSSWAQEPRSGAGPLCSSRLPARLAGLGQLPQPDQIVGRRRKGEDPPHHFEAPMPHLPQPAHGLLPAKDFFDPFAFALADRIARMAGRAPINSAGPAGG